MDYDQLPEPDDRAALDYLDEEYALWIADAKAQQEYQVWLSERGSTQFSTRRHTKTRTRP